MRQASPRTAATLSSSHCVPHVPPGLLVGGEGQRQPSRERRLELAHQGGDGERDGEARLHVARAAPPDAPVLDGAGKRRPRPPRPRRKLVEVSREHEIGRARAEGGDEVGPAGHGLVPLDGDAARREIVPDEGREHAGVAGRVLARDLHEAGAEREQVGLPLPQLVDEPGLEHGACQISVGQIVAGEAALDHGARARRSRRRGRRARRSSAPAPPRRRARTAGAARRTPSRPDPTRACRASSAPPT